MLAIGHEIKLTAGSKSRCLILIGIPSYLSTIFKLFCPFCLTASVFSVVVVVVVILVRNLASVDSLLMSVLLIFVPSWDFASRLVLEDSRRSSELFKHEKDLI